MPNSPEKPPLGRKRENEGTPQIHTTTSRRPTLEDRLEKQRRAQTQARTIRSALRWILYGCGFAGIVSLGVASFFEIQVLLGTGMMLLFTSFIAIVALFFMGGLAPEFVRRGMTESARRKLDD